MLSNELPSFQSDGLYSCLAVCRKCGVHHRVSVEVCGGGHDRSAVASRPWEASTILGIGGGVLCLVMLYFTAGLAGVLVTLAIVGLCLIA